jgi:hypothetical protein
MDETVDLGYYTNVFILQVLPDGRASAKDKKNFLVSIGFRQFPGFWKLKTQKLGNLPDLYLNTTKYKIRT